MANYKLASLLGGNCNQASRGEGPWRLIGNGGLVNVNGNQGFVQLWLTLYTDPSTLDKLSPAVTLLAPLPFPLHLCWKGVKTSTKEARKNGAVKQWRNTEGGKRRGTSYIFILLECSCFTALAVIWKGVVWRQKIPKEAIFHDGTRSSVKRSWRQFSPPNISLQSFSSYISIFFAVCLDFLYFIAWGLW